jgi:hypothetical protein
MGYANTKGPGTANGQQLMWLGVMIVGFILVILVVLALAGVNLGGL